MKKKYFKVLYWLAPIVLVFAIIGQTANTDLFTISGRGSSWNKDIFRITTGLTLQLNNAAGTSVFSVTTAGSPTLAGDMTITNGDIVNGDGTALSTAPVSGNSQGILYTAYLGGVTDAVEGSVLLATTTAVGGGLSVAVSLATNDLTPWIGVAAAAASTGSLVNVYTSGLVLALTTGTVTAGQTLVTSSTKAGYLKADITPITGGDVGVALAGSTGSGGQLTKIRLR